MSICTFFGHKDTPRQAETILRSVLLDLIKNKNVNMFYVGNHGNFDYMVKNTLIALKADHPYINYAVVLAYMPRKVNGQCCCDYSDTVYPEGLEKTPPRYSITKRNEWMLDRSDYAVTYVTHEWGGAAQFKRLAEKKGKSVINLADI